MRAEHCGVLVSTSAYVWNVRCLCQLENYPGKICKAFRSLFRLVLWNSSLTFLML